MRADQWESCWNVIRGSWPTSPGLANEVVKIEWATAFAECDPRWLMDAARGMAKETDRPSVAGLTTWYADLSASRITVQRLERLEGGPTELMEKMPDFGLQYLALDPQYRAEIEEKIKGRYPGAYANRDEPGWGIWSWRCLVVTCEEKGIDPITGGFVGSTSLSARDARERNYQANFERTQRQLLHELGCPRCQQYSQGPTVATKANTLRERNGSPCAVGAVYWEPHYRAGVARPVL